MEKGRGDMTDTESDDEEREGDEGLHSEAAGVGSAVAVAHVAAAAMMPKLAPFPPAGAAGGTKAVEKRAPKRCEHGRQKSQCKECKGEPACSHCLRASLRATFGLIFGVCHRRLAQIERSGSQRARVSPRA